MTTWNKLLIPPMYLGGKKPKSPKAMDWEKTYPNAPQRGDMARPNEPLLKGRSKSLEMPDAEVYSTLKGLDE